LANDGLGRDETVADPIREVGSEPIVLKNSIFAADQNFPAPWSWHHKNDAGDQQV
jgi:hypothetical protein